MGDDKVDVIRQAAEKMKAVMNIIENDPTRIKVIAALFSEVIDGLKTANQLLRKRQ